MAESRSPELEKMDLIIRFIIFLLIIYIILKLFKIV